MKTIHRHQVIVGGTPTTFQLTSSPVRVEASRLGVGPEAPHVVEFWTEYYEGDGPEVERTFQVFGTGHPIPDEAKYWGSTARTPEGLVWHLYEVQPLVGEHGPETVTFARGGIVHPTE